MAKLPDLSGKKFNRLTVKSLYDKKNNHYRWLCECECGNKKIVLGTLLKQGQTKSCGCLNLENAHKLKKINTTHNMSRSKLYKIYYSMLDRCNNPNNANYRHYGGRGITVCEEWVKSFDTFKDWAYDNGFFNGLSIDRIENNQGYSPSNCHWIAKEKQLLNRRNNVYITINGETKLMKEWAEISGIKYNTLRERYVRYGWTGEKLLEKPSPKINKED